MVAFHDRRSTTFDSIEELTPGLHLGPGDSLSKKVWGERFFVLGYLTEEGRRFAVKERLPNGALITRAEDLLTRGDALKTIGTLAPTQTYDI